MKTTEKTKITVRTSVQAPVRTVWKLWTSPEHIIHWNRASEDWCSPAAENDLRPGGKFKIRMEECEGKAGFDFTGVYDDVKPKQTIAYTIDDGRKVRIAFSESIAGTKITETFEAEDENPVDLQRDGWQAILDNFKRYAEASDSRG
ncbi:MAG: SRPBCC domain-containing protein [Spirochaetales bacterium]|nr:SRPBCC domain-containing protein [Spirochaetales bacterium]